MRSTSLPPAPIIIIVVVVVVVAVVDVHRRHTECLLVRVFGSTEMKTYIHKKKRSHYCSLGDIRDRAR